MVTKLKMPPCFLNYPMISFFRRPGLISNSGSKASIAILWFGELAGGDIR
jgi:hypothetical protein